MSATGRKRLYVIYLGSELIEKRRLIPPPPWIPIRNRDAWQHQCDSFAEQLDGEMENRRPPAMGAKPTVAEVDTNGDVVW